ncbi:MAG: glutamate-cysteine ligase family protein [Gammaproteobacteria bacterium]|nr:glutamate-cysteine ligase family protein [Gammaproteobacteria bacterium]MDH5310847.1 glutamate-cysteine ligase family protein [Gammaproteobacteria bacterium]
MNDEREPLHLFQAFGIELEYMIVSSADLSVRPIADELLKLVGGGYEMEVELGPVAWSNELALHVIEMKTNGPSPSLGGLGALFHEHTRRIDDLLRPFDARLLPTAMHPWMDPDTELRLWPHENNIIYETFDRIFSCKGHGWANLQSMHINFPFANDREFGRLHGAIRMVLPLLPGLAASSPFVDGRRSEFLDTRLEMYRKNAARVSSVTGHVVPERVYTKRDYEGKLLAGIYKDLQPLDPKGVLHHEWVNARGCIARFDRMAIEIRLLDLQECPQADIAVAGAVIEAVRALTEQAWSSNAKQQSWDERELEALLLAGIRDADDAVIENRAYLDCFGFPERGRARVRELWQHLFEQLLKDHPQRGEWQPVLDLYLAEGCLARRIVTSVGPAVDQRRLQDVYSKLAAALAEGRLFRAES